MLFRSLLKVRRRLLRRNLEVYAQAQLANYHAQRPRHCRKRRYASPNGSRARGCGRRQRRTSRIYLGRTRHNSRVFQVLRLRQCGSRFRSRRRTLRRRGRIRRNSSVAVRKYFSLCSCRPCSFAQVCARRIIRQSAILSWFSFFGVFCA